MDAALPQGSTGDAHALSRWYRRQDVLSERRAGVCAVVDSDRKNLVRGFETRDRLLHPRKRGGACVRRESRRDHDSCLVVAHHPSGTSRLAAVRYRSQRLDHAIGGAGSARDRRGSARSRSRSVPQDLGTNGASRGGGIGAEIYLRAGKDVLGAGGGNRGATTSQNRDYQSQSAHPAGPGLYRLSTTRSWQDYRGTVLGAASGRCAGFVADEVDGAEADA